MADYDIMPCYDDAELFQDRSDNNVTDLHAYYMSQFNLELEHGSKKNKMDNIKYGVEESFDFAVLDNWTNSNNSNEYDNMNNEITNTISEQNIKEVLLDLDSIAFEEKDLNNETDLEKKIFKTNEYIDDESLIDELCREESETCRLTPEEFSEDFFSPPVQDKNLLPSIETAFSKKYCHFSNVDENNQHFNAVNQTTIPNSDIVVENIDHYSYPNNILYNLDSENKYILPDTPTSCTEFSFENKNERKVSISESIASDVQSSSYYDGNSETLDEEDLFINLDDFGLNFEAENEEFSLENNQCERKSEKEKVQGNLFRIVANT